MKILFILENHYPNIGGVETLFKALTENLVIHGHEVSILTNQFDKTLKRKEVINGVNIIRVPFFNRYIFTLLGIFPALRLARDFDLIHTTSYNAGIPAYFAGRLTKKKVLITFHEYWGSLWNELPHMGYLSKKLHFLFERFLVKLPFTKFIAVSKYTQQRLLTSGIKADKIVHIYNGIEYGYFEKFNHTTTSNPEFTFLYFGRLGISKGIDLLIEAFAALVQKSPEVKLILIIPNQPEGLRKAIIKKMKDLFITEYITIKSELSRDVLFSEINNCDAVVIPSYSEGFCFTAAESVAMDKAIISSDRGALKEVVSGRYLTYQNQDPASLTKAMRKAINGEWRHREVIRYKLSESVNQYLELYRSFE